MIGQETRDFLVSLAGHLQDKGELAKGGMEDREWYMLGLLDSECELRFRFVVWAGPLGQPLSCGFQFIEFPLSAVTINVNIRAFTGVMGQGTWSKEFGSHQNT